MWQNELSDRFARAEEMGDSGAVRIRVGERPHLHTVAIVKWDDRYTNKSDTIEALEVETIDEASQVTAQILEDAEFGTVYPNCRVDFKHAETGRDLPSWSGTVKTNDRPAAPDQSTESVLCEALRQNNEVMRKMVDIAAETFRSREERMDDDRDTIMELSRAEVLARAEAEMTQILAEEAAQATVEDDPLKARAGEILGVIAEKFLAPQEGKTARDTVLAILRDDPRLTAQLAADEEVVSLFSNAMMKNEEEAAVYDDLVSPLDASALDAEALGRAVEEAALELSEIDTPNPMAPDTNE